MKGIAIIGVTLFHMFPNAIRGGYLGVSLFFVISGYLLAFTSLQQWQRGTFTVRQYFKKRLQRLYPPLLIMVLTTVGIYSYLLPKTMVYIQGEALSILLGYNNWWQITQQADYFARMANASPFTPLWFLSIEMQYIVLWVFLFGLYIFLAHKWRPSVGIGVIAVLGIATAAIMPLRYVPGQDVTPLYYGTDTRIYDLLFGAVLGLVRANRYGSATHFTARGKMVLTGLFMCCMVATLVGYCNLDGQNPLVYQGLMLTFTLVCCLMILLCESPHLSIGRYMDMPVLAWLGRNSYGIFLWQYPVLCMAHRMHWEVAFTSPYIYYCVLVSLILLLTSWTDELVKVLLDTDARRAFLANLAKTHKNITIIDWYGFIKDHPELLADDGVHPNEKGAAAYANLVAKTIRERLGQKKG